MMKMKWAGVMPATTTAFDEKLNIDRDFVIKHAKWLIDHGCTGS
jgi:4-hydroxy-tetrahydrodipicolinate synthase